MNPLSHDGSGLDARARGLHRAALAQMSPQTLARLRAGRHEAQRAAPSHPWRWLAATALTAVLAVGFGLQFLPRAPSAPAPAPTAASPATVADGEASLDETSAGTLEEDPDLYLWLASADAQPLAME